MNSIKSASADILWYNLGDGVEAFSLRRNSSFPFPIIRPHQVHGTKIVVAEDIAQQLGILPANLTRDDLFGFDAIVTQQKGLGIAVRTADCIPVLLYDPIRKVVAAVHAGWRGTVQYIVHDTIALMKTRFGIAPSNLMAQIGPGIALASFQVGAEVVEMFRSAGFPMSQIYEFQGEILTDANLKTQLENTSANASTPRSMAGGHHINLFEANRWMLEKCGVLPANINVCGIDTYTDCNFFSARREGNDCGRIHSGIRLKP